MIDPIVAHGPWWASLDHLYPWLAGGGLTALMAWIGMRRK